MSSQTKIDIPQYSLAKILTVWALAALPMAILAWIFTPLISRQLNSPTAFTEALLICLTLGLIWQFVLVMLLVRNEQGNLRWQTLKVALWLKQPINPKTGKTSNNIWWLLVPLIIAFGAEELIPIISHPASRDLGIFIESVAGMEFFKQAWGWYGLTWVLLIFNTVLGEELLFRGLLLPRMNEVFGNKDWLANGVLFGLYHLHTPWVIPSALLDTFIISYPVKRYRSAWIGIIVHSVQSIFIGLIILALVI